MRTLICGGHVVTLNAARDVFDGGFVLVGDHGRIEAVGPAEACPQGDHALTIDARGTIVVPGLIDAQHQLGRNLRLPQPSSWAAVESASASLPPGDALVRSAAIAAHTLAQGGVTCALHVWPALPDEDGLRGVVGRLAAAGLRQLHALPYRPRPDELAVSRQRALQQEDGRVRDLAARCHGSDDGRVALWVDVATSLMATARGEAFEEATRAAWDLARSLGLRVLTRSSAADGAEAAGIAAALREHGRSEIMHLMELGVLDERWLVVGGETLGATDVALMHESGCAAVCTPLDESLRGLGWGPWLELRQRGVRCALGSGDLTMHAGTDMVAQAKALMLAQNTARLDATAFSAEAVLEMLTLDAARALGLDAEIGSLEPGKRADVAVFDLRALPQVAHKPLSVFITCAGGADARWVMVDGRLIVDDFEVPPAVVAGSRAALDEVLTARHAAAAANGGAR